MNALVPEDHPVVGQITLRYWASARAEAGLAEESVPVAGPVTLAAVLADAVARRGAGNRLEQVLSTCSVLLGDQPVGSVPPEAVEVVPGATVEFLPPFAGG